MRTEIWVNIILWTSLTCAAVFFMAGVVGTRTQKCSQRLCIVFGMAVLGFATGFTQGGVSAALMAALYNAVPYVMGIDSAAGLGMGQAIIILYFHLGRGDFVHR